MVAWLVVFLLTMMTKSLQNYKIKSSATFVIQSSLLSDIKYGCRLIFQNEMDREKLLLRNNESPCQSLEEKE